MKNADLCANICTHFSPVSYFAQFIYIYRGVNTHVNYWWLQQSASHQSNPREISGPFDQFILATSSIHSQPVGEYTLSSHNWWFPNSCWPGKHRHYCQSVLASHLLSFWVKSEKLLFSFKHDLLKWSITLPLHCPWIITGLPSPCSCVGSSSSIM